MSLNRSQQIKGPKLWLQPTGLYWKSKAIRPVPPVSKKFTGTVTHG